VISIFLLIAYCPFAISDDLKAVAFQKAIELLSQDASTKASPTTTTNAQRSNLPLGSAEGGVDKISRKLTLSVEAVSEVYSDNDQGVVDVVVGVGKLDNSTATATKQLALLVTGARQLTESEQWTESKHIRNLCIHYGRFDSANFAKTVKQMDDAFSFKGKGQQLEVRLHQRGVEKLKHLIANLTDA
jgi:hypothetical protein